MKPARIVLLVVGTLVALVGFALGAASVTLGFAMATQRDADGFFATDTERFATDAYALTSERIDLGDPGLDDWWADRELATARVSARSATDAVFVGIGPEPDVSAYLAGVPHDELVDVDFRPFSAEYRRHDAAGTATPAPPGEQPFWVAQASGPATQEITWDLEPGRWVIVVMNASGAQGVTADIQIGGRIEHLLAITLGLGGASIALLAIAAAIIIGTVTRVHPEPAPAGAPVGTGSTAPPLGAAASAPVHPVGASATHPLALEGHLDPHLSRWKWLVKWILAIPHAIVLLFLWIAFAVLTIVAFFAILFTGRYPRAMFDFNVGVLRWTWRVGYYATSAIGSDRYPPFTLAAVPGDPATLEVEYPERLSRGLVLVKSWLLAIPHLLLVGVFTATWTIGDTGGARTPLGGGLLGLLVLITGVILLFTGRYPTGLHDLNVGINRWIFRVVVYVALMTDHYPPFRLDQGASEPATPDTDRPAATGSLPAPPAPPA